MSELNELINDLRDESRKHLVTVFDKVNDKTRKFVFNIELLSTAYAIAIFLCCLTAFSLPVIALSCILMLLFNGELLLQLMFMTIIFVIIITICFAIISVSVSLVLVLMDKIVIKSNKNQEE